jgi:hypothetical protein
MAEDAAMRFPPLDYISEDELNTYEGWLKYQAIDLSALNGDEAADVRGMFDEAVKRRETARKVGRMKLKRLGDSLYAVAIRDGSDLWLALWVKRSRIGEFFIFHPTADGDWNPHTSLHTDGMFHLKSHGRATLPPQQKQPPTAIKGTEHLGGYMGCAPKEIGAVCDAQDFTGVFEAPAGILGPRNGQVTVDLIEPGSSAQPLSHPAEEVARHLFTDAAPHVLIRIFRS